MCRRSRRGRRRCVFTFWEKGGGEEFSGQTLVGGGAGWEIYASSSSFGLPPFFPLFCYLVSQASSPSSSSSSFRIFISSFLRFAMEDGKGKEATPAASPSSSVPSLRAKKNYPFLSLSSIRSDFSFALSFSPMAAAAGLLLLFPLLAPSPGSATYFICAKKKERGEA